MQNNQSTHLDAGVRTEIEVELTGVSDTNVHRGASWNVTTATHLHVQG